MKSISITAALGICLLTACASGPAAYAPAQKSGGYGYTQQQIQNDRFQLSFTGANEDEARNLALLRAAELTLDNGYTHFRVIANSMNGKPQGRSPVSTSVGIGTGIGGGRRGTSVGLGIGLGNAASAFASKKVTSRLEIVLENAPANPGPNVYDAKQVTTSIRPAPVYP